MNGLYLVRKNGTFLGANEHDILVSPMSVGSKALVCARLSYRDIVPYQMKINRDIVGEDIDSYIEVKMYEDAGLSIQNTYKISYLDKDIVEDGDELIEAFAVQIESLREKFANSYLKKVKHIDYLCAPFLAYKTLYTNKVLEPKNDIFVYIDDDEAFLSIYKGGQYISSRTVSTFKEIVNQCVSTNPSFSYEDYKDAIEKRGISKENYDSSTQPILDSIQSVLFGVLNKISDVTLHTRNIYKMAKIDRIFFRFGSKGIMDVESIFDDFDWIESKSLPFRFFKDEINDQYDLILLSYVTDKYTKRDDDYSDNFTIFDRKPSVLSLTVTKFFISLAASLLILFSSDYVFEYLNKDLNSKLNVLSGKSNSLKDELKGLQASILNKNASIKKINEDISTILSKQEQINLELDSIYVKISKRIVNVSDMIKISKLIKKHGLFMDSYEMSNGESIVLEVNSDIGNGSGVANFILSLREVGFKGVVTDAIRSDKDKYYSIIRVLI